MEKIHMDSRKRAFAGEFLSSFLISFFGLVMIVPMSVSGIMNLFEFSILFGILVAFAIILFGSASGAHFNPVVTLALVVSKRQRLKTLWNYISAQYLGWFAGACLIYIVFWNQLTDFHDTMSGNPVTLFFCNTKDLWLGIWIEFIWTALLMVIMLTCQDTRVANRPGASGFPFVIGSFIAVAIAACGSYSGMSLNGARDFGPRLAGLLFGWIQGYDVSACFSDGKFLLYMFVPMIGGISGTFFYDKCISKLLTKN